MQLPKAKPSTPDQDLQKLFFLTRFIRDESLNQTEIIEQLLQKIEGFQFSPLGDWDLESLRRARHFAEEMTIYYVSHFHNLKELPVTYYKREKSIRRHLDLEFSHLFQEIIRRSGRPYHAELITEEPIYYLLQKAREKSFPKTPKSKGKRPLLNILRMRFHVELSAKLDPDANDREDRRVLLPFEIK